MVIVMALLVIVLGLAITFLSRMSIERSASAGYAASASTRQLADSAVNIVQGQIRDATTQGLTVAWASQPGMIRTFGNSAGGPTLKAYKLYSSDKLILDSPTVADLNEDLPVSSWASDRAVWTDLNAPVLANGVASYPIIDPAAVGQVEGFSLSGAPISGTTNPAPMPVKWLYVLQNGDLVCPSGSGGSANVAGATPGNPIVGRIAFWTDDETCKININTASEGTYWDSPRLNSSEDRNFAKIQPVQKEFQRYPGHPATTSLAPVLFASNGVTPDPLSKAQRDAIYEITPRIVGGGSDGGSVVYTGTGALSPDSDRLFASVDELIFNASRNSQTSAAAIDRAKLERAKFFLTASSRAPEVTLFNTPRVTAWPIDVNNSDAYRTPFDQLIAFCSTINGEPYYFTRSDPKSATVDFDGSLRNKQLYAYLQDLSSRAIPGFGGDFLSKYPDPGSIGSDRDQILTEIFDYIRSVNINDTLVSNPFSNRGIYGSSQTPGFGQVTPIRIGKTQGFGRFATISEVGIHFICTADGGTGQPGGIAGSNVMGNSTLGNPATLLTANQRRIEAMILFEPFIAGQGWPPISPAFTLRVKGLENLNITNVGNAGLFPANRFSGDGPSGISRNFLPGYVSGGINWGGTLSPRWLLSYAQSPARLGGQLASDVGSTNPYNDPFPTYPFISDPVTVDASTGTLQFSGGTITVEIFAGQQTNVTGLTPVNTIQMTFDPASFPIPSLVQSGTGSGGNASFPVTTRENWWTFSAAGCIAGQKGRLASMWQTPVQGADGTRSALFRSGDVVRTLVPVHSDFRLLAANGNVAFVGINNYSSSTIAIAHSFGDGGKNAFLLGYTPAGLNKGLAKDVTYNLWGNPDVARYSTKSEIGDWDNGIAAGADGPYLNKPDEGNTRSSSGSIPYFDNEEQYTAVGGKHFSPNRQMPSAGMFGSLPTGIKSGQPYQTLLFRPQPSHPQSEQSRPGQPADHLWTDLFWMPVVEPYAISEPFSTAGKINMNYAITPFSYIHRTTGITALLRSERLLGIRSTSAGNYKVAWNTPISDMRARIDIPQTLFQFEAKFNSSQGLFRSPSQICDMYLIPEGESWISSSSFNQSNLESSAATYWGARQLTGDNSRERPYTNLLGRLTTKSNTFTVHYRVQALKKVPGSTASTWDETKDKVTGEYRGSTTIERYITPDDAVPNYGGSSDLTSLKDLGSFYKWRVLRNRQFAP